MIDPSPYDRIRAILEVIEESLRAARDQWEVARPKVGVRKFKTCYFMFILTYLDVSFKMCHNATSIFRCRSKHAWRSRQRMSWHRRRRRQGAET